MPRFAAIIGLLAAAALLFWQFPLFHIVPLEQVESARAAETFDAPAYAKQFWTKKLVPHFDAAADAAEVVAAMRSDPQQARREFGRQVGLSRSTLLFLRGRGTIVAVDEREVGVALAEGATEADLALVAGRVVGNAVRDATGVVTAGDFANSQHFNDLARELNLLVEAGPVNALKQGAAPGNRIRFVGCAQIVGDRVTWPLKVIPLDVSFE